MSTFEIGTDYVVPPWAGAPQDEFYLEVIKNHNIIEEIKIDQKAFYLVGKHHTVCDIVLMHESISRKHCVFQYKDNGTLWIYDMNSANKTYVNNKPLPSKIFHELKPFDQIKFGFSQRNYTLRCVNIEEKDVENDTVTVNYQGLKQKYLYLLHNDPYYKQLKKQQTSFKDNQNEDDQQVWGMQDNDLEVYEYQDQDDYILEPNLLFRLPDLTEKQKEKIEKYEILMKQHKKIENQLEEIEKKEKQQGLGDKEQENKNKIQEKFMESSKNVDSAEQAVRISLFNEEKVSIFEKQQQQMEFFDKYHIDNEDDDFLDRTKEKKVEDKVFSNNTEDYYQLKDKLRHLIKSRQNYNSFLLDMPEMKAQDSNDSEDELEKFMNQNDNQLNQENKQIMVKKIQEINIQIEEISSQLKIIQPTYHIQEEKAFQKKEIKEKKQKIQEADIGQTLNKLQEIQKNIQKEEEEGEVDEQQILKEVASELKYKKQKFKQENQQKYEIQQIQEENRQHIPKRQPNSRNNRETEDQDFIDLC